ncbi:MAG: atoC [Fibrobacteres bacterium]|nr:atoC [Fibrobacterota bacterium]
MKTIHALLVDDDTQSLETMGLILEMDEYLVSRASSGRMALERMEGAELAQPTVDFLVMDLDMANLSGIELLTEMRRRGHNIPVMVVTGFASKGTVVELLRQGVVDFLDKPIHLEEFRIRVRRMANEALKRRRRIAPPRDPAVESADAPFRSLTVLDLANLGVPYSLRRQLDAPERNSLVLACRRPSGFDILLADIPGQDAESFYASVLIKTHFDRCRSQKMEGGEFMASLNRVIFDGAFKKRDLEAIFIRIRYGERRIEIHPAGLPCQCLVGLGGTAPRALSFSGSPLGSVQEPGLTVCGFPYLHGDRIFFVSDTRPAHGEAHKASAAILRESRMPGPQDNLDATADGLWRDMRSASIEGESHDFLLLGLELD